MFQKFFEKISSFFSEPQKEREPVEVKAFFMDMMKSEISLIAEEIEGMDETIANAQKELKESLKETEEVINKSEGFNREAVEKKLFIEQRIEQLPELKKEKLDYLTKSLEEHLKQYQEVRDIEFKEEENSKEIFIDDFKKSEYSDEQKEAIEFYRNNAYNILNQILRTDGELSPELEKTIEGIDSSFQPIPNEMKVYRGVAEKGGVEGNDEFFEKLKSMQEGEILEEKAYTSTSKNEEQAGNYGAGGYVFEITLPEGAMAIDTVSNDVGEGTRDQEEEILLPRGAQMKLSGRDGNKMLFDLVKADLKKSETTEYMRREDMPQFDADDFVEFLKSKGVNVELKDVELNKVKHRQIDLDGAKIDAIVSDFKDGKDWKPVLVDNEFNVVDGNHRAAAIKQFGRLSVPFFVADQKIEDIFKMAEEYGSVDFSKSYKQKFDNLLSKYGVSSFDDLSGDQKSKFLSTLDAMHTSKEEESRMEKSSPCWDGYKKVPGKKDYEEDSCVKKSEDDDGYMSDGEIIKGLCEGETFEKAEYQGRDVELNKPFRNDSSEPGKFTVYAKNDKGNIVKLNFGDENMKIKRDDPERKRAFRSRFNCDDPGPKWKKRYWACDQW